VRNAGVPGEHKSTAYGVEAVGDGELYAGRTVLGPDLSAGPGAAEGAAVFVDVEARPVLRQGLDFAGSGVEAVGTIGHIMIDVRAS